MGGFGTWVVAVAVGLLTVRLLRVSMRDVLASPVLARYNYRGAVLPVGAGILMVLAVVAVESSRAALGALGLGDEVGLTTSRSLVLFGVVAFGLLGFIDDALGAEGSDGAVARGFRGHVTAALHGTVTTGFLKLAGGGAVAILLVATPGFRSGGTLVVDALLIALCANLANLFDRAPGRTLKIAFVAYAPLAVLLGSTSTGVAIAVMMGAALGLLRDDLGERVMLGDTGVNPLGAVLGLGLVLGAGFSVRVIALVIVGLLNVAAEVVSFSAVIERVPFLRSLDRAGRSGRGGT